MITRGAARLASVTHGTGVPVLLVHGYAVDHRILLPLDAVFDRHRGPWERVYVDLPGHGASPSGDIASADGIADALDAFIGDRFGGRRFAVVGSSFGGVLARRLVARRASQVLGVALLCPSAEPVPARTLPPREVRIVDDVLLASLDPSDAAEYAAMAVVQDPATWATFRDAVLPGLRSTDARLLAVLGDRPTLGERPEASFATFDRPGLMILGRQDHVVGWRDQLALAPSYPRMTIAILDAAGHNAHLERPAETEVLLEGWLDAVRAQRSRRDRVERAPGVVTVRRTGALTVGHGSPAMRPDRGGSGGGQS